MWKKFDTNLKVRYSTRMIIFIDESGIHKHIDHSSFALVYVTVQNKETLENSVEKIERNHGVKEFHWVDLPWKLRADFIKEAARLPFAAKVAIFKNPISRPEALEWALRHTLVEKNFRAIYIDGQEPKWIERRLKKILRDRGLTIKKLKTVRSGSSPGIRLADALAGLSRAYFDNPDGKAKPLWEIMRKKITAQLLGGQTDG
ncbi:MAG: hypothetical protein A3H70_00625 [Candidatus Komeilibacteria bacterium RIFCSPLOWO2_02_FULL_48_11]|uniref:DUF3800 domain-containing protein n=1 Tax=Candidatus Komeilibacteria bacterium RIFCSPLOWO2_02_FULL_48_11 TaxID=1798553 RepID=A0A1G2BVG1_9BACT|nr:MAG: hypothetical protein A3H70_00625 [Candidatus Komeilibacteria bacterium RIFCSPLOWO2_02_FULL_48_11]